MNNGESIVLVLKWILSGVGFGLLIWVARDWWQERTATPPPASPEEDKVTKYVKDKGIWSLTLTPPEGLILEEIKKSFDLIPIAERVVREQIDKVLEVLDEENASSIAERTRANDDAKRVLAILQNYHMGDVGQLKDLLKEKLTYLAESIIESTSRIARFNAHNPETRDYE